MPAQSGRRIRIRNDVRSKEVDDGWLLCKMQEETGDGRAKRGYPEERQEGDEGKMSRMRYRDV